MVLGLKSCVLLLASLATTQACVEIYATSHAGLRASTTIELKDNGKKICSSPNQSGQKDCDKDGYGIKWSTIPAKNGEFDVEYRTPKETYKLKVPGTCVFNNSCCGGMIPCTCASCTFKSKHFCG